MFKNLLFLCFLKLSVASINIFWYDDGHSDVAVAAVTAAIAMVDRNEQFPTRIVKMVQADLETRNDETDKMICEKIGELEEIHLILDTTRGLGGSETLRRLSSSLGVPMMSFNYQDNLKEFNSKTSETFVNIRPPGDVLSNLLRQIIVEKNITNAAVIHDDTIILRSQYNAILSNLPVLHAFEMAKNVQSQLDHFSRLNLKNIFAVGSLETIKSVLEVAGSLEMLKNKFSWFAITKDNFKAADFRCSCQNAVGTFMGPEAENINAVRAMRKISGIQISNDLDVTFYYENAIKAMTAARKKKIFIGNFSASNCFEKFENFMPRNDVFHFMDEIRQIASSSSPSFGSFFFDDKNDDAFLKYSVHVSSFRNVDGNLKIVDLLAKWDSSVPNVLQLEPNTSLSHGQDGGPVYRVVVVVQPPFVHKEVSGEGTITYTGFCIDLLDNLAALLNFRYTIKEASDGQYGVMDKNYKWNGIVKELMDDNCDIGVGAIPVQAERERVIDFTIPFYENVGQIIMMQKPHNPTSLFKFMTVLDDVVWVCIVLAYFATSCIIYLLDKYSPYSYQNNRLKYEDDELEKRVFDFRESLWFCITCVIPQGGGATPKNLSGKIMSAFWWLFVFIVIASYIANLAAFLTVSRLAIPISSLRDLSKQYEIRYSPLNGSSTMLYFERRSKVENVLFDIWENWTLDLHASQNDLSQVSIYEYPVEDIYAKIKRFMEETGLPNTMEEAVHLIRNPPFEEAGGQYAFVGDATDIHYAVLTNCDLQTVGEQFSKTPYAFAVQNGSPLKRQLNFALTELFTDRYTDYLKSKWWENNPNAADCPPVVGDDESGGISIYNIGGLFIIIFIGVICSLVALALEYWFYNKPSENQRSDHYHSQEIPKMLNSPIEKNQSLEHI